LKKKGLLNVPTCGRNPGKSKENLQTRNKGLEDPDKDSLRETIEERERPP